MNTAMQTVEWEILLPIIGVKFKTDVEFGPFSLRHASMENLREKHQLRLKEDFWCSTVLSVKIPGHVVPEQNRCRRCARHKTDQTQPRLIDGQMVDVVTLRNKECICIATIAGGEPTDVIGMALPLLEDMLSLLRLFIFIGHRGQMPAHNLISLQHLPHYSTVVGVTDSGKSYSEDLLPGTRIHDVPLHQKDIDLWILAWNFETLAATVYRSHTGQHVTPLHEIIGASMIQFGAMMEETNLRDCFLRGATAVEALTNQAGGTGGVSAKFREFGATFAVIAAHPDLASQAHPVVDSDMKQEWAAIEDDLKELYKQRCHISHGSRRLHESNEETLFNHRYQMGRIAVGALLLFDEISNSSDQFYARLKAVRDTLAPPAPVTPPRPRSASPRNRR
ncbi:hypothetical protein [Duganella sp. Dugasp56]|uniref:hypothetical protein n=1 Tax=Duganella sp. Dugasp56 TaxID=3243046 RepID=UPI0039AF16E7